MKIQLDKPREISFTMNALKVYEEETGVSLLEGVKDFNAGMMINLTYAGLLGADMEMKLSINDVGKLITLPLFHDVIEQFKKDIKRLTGAEETTEKK